MDLVIVRENTEGFYSDRNMHQGIGEFMPDPDMARYLLGREQPPAEHRAMLDDLLALARRDASGSTQAPGPADRRP